MTQRQKDTMRGRVLLGVNEYGCWECTLLPDTLSEENQPDKIWVFARSLREVVDCVPGVETALFLGKATCVADPLTPGTMIAAPSAEPTPATQHPASLQAALEQAAQPPEEKAACPFCHHEYRVTEFTPPPDGITTDSLTVICPNPMCKMIIRRHRLIRRN